MPETDSPYILLIKLKMKPGEEETFKRELQEILKQVRQEPACIDITGHQDPEDPSRYMLFEVWTSAEAFAEFESGRAYIREYLARVGELWAEPRDLSVWERVA